MVIRIVIVLFVLLPFITLIACETSPKPSEITELRGIYLELHGNVKFGTMPCFLMQSVPQGQSIPRKSCRLNRHQP